MKKLFALLSMAVLLLVGCAAPAKNSGSFTQLTMEQGLAQMEKETDFVLLDVRRQDEFDAGHIPGAVCIPNESIGSTEISQLPDKNQKIFVYCRSGNRSKQAASKLVKLGYTNIIEIGGIIDYPLEPVTD